MTMEASSLTLQGATASACAAAGLALLAPERPAAFARFAALAAVMALWVGLWQSLAPWLGPTLARAAPEGLSWPGIAGLNMATAALAWLPAWLVLRLLGPKGPVPRLAAAAAALAFFAGLVLPALGQGGAWPPESIALAIFSACLALLLGMERTRRER